MKERHWLGVCLLVAFAARMAQPRQKPRAKALVGLWGAEQELGPLVQGELIVDGRGPDWRARIGGFDVPVDRESSHVNFKLPAEAGEFRGRD